MMATRFELELSGGSESELRAIGEAALNEISDVERRLSFYLPSSELSRINRDAAIRPVALAPDLFELFELTKHLHNRTGGAFDPTIGPLMSCWDMLGRGRVNGREQQDASRPSQVQIDDARSSTGLGNVLLDSEAGTIQFAKPEIKIDLGGIAKGFGIEQATALLLEEGISGALLHGGTSTVSAIGMAPDGNKWKIGIADGAHVLGTIELFNQSLSVSAQSGKMTVIDGVHYGHILDPRTGWPASDHVVAACVSDSATISDALSTAALVLGESPEIQSFENEGFGIWSQGLTPQLTYSKGLPAFQPR
jgi:thiamine biosynthesis lipoprotein